MSTDKSTSAPTLATTNQHPLNCSTKLGISAAGVAAGAAPTAPAAPPATKTPASRSAAKSFQQEKASAIGEMVNKGNTKMKRKQESEMEEDDENAKKKKKKINEVADAMPTGVAVAVFSKINETLHVLGFQEDRHEWPDGIRKGWDSQYLRNAGRGSFPSSPFQLYTDVPVGGFKVPGYVLRRAQMKYRTKNPDAGCLSSEAKKWFDETCLNGEHWTREHCLRMMLVHMLSKGWAPICVAKQFDAAEKSFEDFVTPFKEQQKSGLAKSWQEQVAEQLTPETWEAFSNFLKAYQPNEDWHFTTIPAENCKGKDMSTRERRRAEALKALSEEAGIAFDAEFDDSECCAKVTDGKYKTSVHALQSKEPLKLLRTSQTTLQARQEELQWRCPHNWAGVRGACFYESGSGEDSKSECIFTAKDFKEAFEECIKANRETCKPCWIPMGEFAKVFDVKSQAAINLVVGDVSQYIK